MDISAYDKIPKKNSKKITISNEAQMSDYAMSVRTKEIEDLTKKLKTLKSSEARRRLGKKINELNLLNKATLDAQAFKDAQAKPSLPPDWGRKATTVKQKPQHRPTKEEVQAAIDAVKKAKEDIAKRNLNRRETINFLGEVSRKAGEQQSDFSSDMFALNLRKQLGNSKLNKELIEVQKVFNEQKMMHDAEVADILANPRYMKAKKKLLKSMKKRLDEIHKKAKKKLGKKMTQLLFNRSVVDFNKLVSCDAYPEFTIKKFKKARKALNAKHMEIEEDCKIVQKEIDKCKTECPHLAPEDLSIADHSDIAVKGRHRGEILKKERVQLPGDKIIEDFDIRKVLDEKGLSLEALDLGEIATLDLVELAKRMP